MKQQIVEMQQRRIFPSGGGEMGRLIREKDWSGTQVGPIERWPQSLKTAVEMILGCHFPMIILWGKDLVQIYNDGYRQIMGSKHPAGMGQPTRECWPELWLFNKPIYESVKKGETITLNDQLFRVTRHGYLEDAYFTLCYSPVRNEAGNINGVLMTVFETTRKLQTGHVLRRAAELDTFRVTLADALGLLTDPVEIQAEAARVLGRQLGASRSFYAEAEPRGEHVVIHKDYHTGLPGVAGRYWLEDFGWISARPFHSKRILVVNDVTSNPNLTEVERKSFAAIGVKAHVTECLVRNNRIVALFGVHQSMPRAWTEDEVAFIRETAEQTYKAVKRARAEEALRRSEERLRTILNAAEMGTWEWDINSDSLEWNEQVYVLLGLDPAKNKDKPKEKDDFLQFIYPPDREAVSKELKKAMDETGIFQAKFRIIRAHDARIRWMKAYGRVIRSKDNSTCMAGMIYDINEQEALKQQKDEFIGIASHELKTPVTSIKMYVELIRQRLEDNGDDQNADLVQKLDRQVNRLMEQINNLLDTTKIAEGHLPLHEKQFNLNELIEECVEVFQDTSEKHQIVFFQPGQPEVIKADRERIRQVITNLISNAIKYSPQGGEVTLVSEKTEHEVKVSIRDMGIGISEEMQDKLFKRFSRIGETHTYPGVGLGLYISANIIHQHGGTISVKSKPGQGSVFSFTLPFETTKNAAL